VRSGGEGVGSLGRKPELGQEPRGGEAGPGCRAELRVGQPRPQGQAGQGLAAGRAGGTGMSLPLAPVLRLVDF
jgi:hypothetical protein